MEMDFLHSAAVNFSLCFGNSQKHFFGFSNDVFRKIGMIQNLFYVMQIPVFVVMMVCMLVVFMIVFMFMMVVTIAMLFVNMFMVMAVSNTVSMHPGMIVFMIVVVPVFMLISMMMVIIVCMFMIMLVVVMMLMVMFVFRFFRKHNIKILCLNPAFIHTFMDQFIVSQMKFGKLFLQERKRHSCVQQRAK